LSGHRRADKLALVTPQEKKIDCEQLVNSFDLSLRPPRPAEIALQFARQAFSVVRLARRTGLDSTALQHLTEGIYASLRFPKLSPTHHHHPAAPL
jgi:hypothetical protein